MKNRRLPNWKNWHETITPFDYVRSTENQMKQAESIEKITNLTQNSQYSVLEIGPSDGGMAYKLLSNNSNILNYTMVDDKTMLDKCKENLSRFTQVQYVTIEEFDSIKTNSYDILISNHCLEETPKDYQLEVYTNLFPNVSEVFILCNTENAPMWGEFDPDLLYTHLDLNFKSVKILPGHSLSRPSQKIYYANESK